MLPKQSRHGLQERWSPPVVSATKMLAADPLGHVERWICCGLDVLFLHIPQKIWGPGWHLEHHVCQTIPEQYAQFVRYIIVLKEATAIGEYHCHKRVYLVCKNAYVGGMCQTDICKNAWTWRFSVEHCPKDQTPSNGLSSSNSASWWDHSPRQWAHACLAIHVM